MSDGPLFTALATSTRQLHVLLRSIAFVPQAQVQITPEGIRFSTNDVHAIQASTLLDKSLFSSYQVKPSAGSIPPFQINVTALLETLQIFGVSETTNGSSSSNHRAANGGISSTYLSAYHTPALGLTLSGTCKITYPQPGAPLSITIIESGITTTCSLHTYTVPNMYTATEDLIPLDRNALTLKIIMPSAWLHDAISELASTNSESLLISASSTTPPYFALEGHGGPFGDSTVDFMPDKAPIQSTDAFSGAKRRKQPAVTEAFTVAAPKGSGGRIKQRFRFDMIRKAGRAMAAAQKVSIRMDQQGVLSLQFMIEVVDSASAAPGTTTGTLGGIGPGVAGDAMLSFVDYRFVPLAEEGTSDEGNGNSDEDEDEDDNEADEDEEYYEGTAEDERRDRMET